MKEETFVSILTSIHNSYVNYINFGNIVGKEYYFDLKTFNEIMEDLEDELGLKNNEITKFMNDSNFGYTICDDYGCNEMLENKFFELYELSKKQIVEPYCDRCCNKIKIGEKCVEYFYVKNLDEQKVAIQHFINCYTVITSENNKPALGAYLNACSYIKIKEGDVLTKEYDDNDCVSLQVYSKDDFEKKYSITL